MNKNDFERFEAGFQDGVYAIPRNKQEPRVKVRALYDYCQANNVNPEDLSEQEIKQFLDRGLSNMNNGINK